MHIGLILIFLLLGLGFGLNQYLRDNQLLIDPKDACAYSRRGFDRALKGQLRDALEDLNHAVVTNGDHPTHFINRAYVKLKLGNIEGAVIDIDHGLRMDPKNAKGYAVRYMIRSAKGDPLAGFDLQEANRLDTNWKAELRL